MIKVKKYKTLGSSEAIAAKQQIETGLMSGFVGAPGQEFYGGESIRLFEKCCSDKFGYEHAISVNSWTSGLLLMLLALEKESGEVIVTPWTMSATVMAIIQAGFVPVFVDIDKDSFMPLPNDVRCKVTSQTVAILMADIFGQCFPFEQLQDLRSNGIILLSDGAQAHAATRFGKHLGFGSDLTGISFNRHKHVNTGEGGVILTNNDRFAEYCFRARNHGENYNSDGYEFKNLFGYNFRLTETQAEVGIIQLNQMDAQVYKRRKLGALACRKLERNSFIRTPPPLNGNEHSYYILPLILTGNNADENTRKYINFELNSLGWPPLSEGYVNVHKLPIFNSKQSLTEKYHHLVTKPSLPMAEMLHDKTFMGIMTCNYDFTEELLDEYLDTIIRLIV
ncbi:DegT/DnrJ/EryC1/StrS family aminotransferase [Amylibacter sp.]|jgi:perosamine synthetase|nr:DegT/DnrJ/EryC1/StrS family aminotransferase [Amylibacter sp.]